jgi:HD-like signal output (HDOD) protein
MEEIDKFIKNVLDDLRNNRLKLPTLPQVALKITDTIDNPKSTAKDVTRIVATDAALSARLIQVANSAMYRTNTPVEDVQNAVTRLGMKQVRNIASSLLIRQLFHTKYAGLKKRLELLWSHSAHVAAICTVFAKKHKELKPDEAMLAGLVCAIGHLPIMSYAEKFPTIANDDKVLNDITQKIGPTLGKAMLKAWKFPAPIVTVVAEHEDLSRDHEGPPDLCDLVSVANLHTYIGTTHPLAHVNWADVPALKKLGLTPEESIEAMKSARDEITELKNLLTN